MNASGCKDPTFDEAVGNINRRERLCKKHNVHIGQVLHISILELIDDSKHRKKKRIKVKIIDVHDRFVVIQRKAGYNETMFWRDFHEARSDN